MAEGSIDIFIDWSYFSTVSGASDVNVNSFFKPDDNIGLRDLLTEYNTVSGSPALEYIDAEFFMTTSGVVSSGIGDAVLTYELQNVISGSSDINLTYSLPTYISGGIDESLSVDLEYSPGRFAVNTSTFIRGFYTAGRPTSASFSFPTYFRSAVPDTDLIDNLTDYIAGGYYDSLIPGDPLDQVTNSGIFDARSYFTAGALNSSGTLNPTHEVFFPGYPMEFNPDKYTYRFDSICGVSGTQGPYPWDLNVILGAVQNIPFNMLSTVSGLEYVNVDSICGVSGTEYLIFESQTTLGTISHYIYDAVCGVSGTTGFSFDVDLLSLKISNFSLDVEEYGLASGSMCVDVTDDVHSVVTSGTYFIINDQTVSGTFTPITDGYRMCYDPVDDFSSMDGYTVVIVHAQNDNYSSPPDVLEVGFYVTSGYIVEFNHIRDPYDYDKQVVVQGFAENMASCPVVGADAYWFTTVPKVSKNLGATIVGSPWKEKDLGASIYPTTDLIYFYGKVFRIEVRAKDLAGNVMEPYIFEFKIEDKPD